MNAERDLSEFGEIRLLGSVRLRPQQWPVPRESI